MSAKISRYNAGSQWMGVGTPIRPPVEGTEHGHWKQSERLLLYVAPREGFEGRAAFGRYVVHENGTEQWNPEGFGGTGWVVSHWAYINKPEDA